MPQILLLFAAAGAGILVVRRWYREEQRRVAAELARARQAMEQRERDEVVPLERDPATGIYRPRRG